MSRHWNASPPRPDDRYRPWLAEPGSLTRRIIARCGEFRVQRRFEGLRMPGSDEASSLALPERHAAHVREVILLADEVPVVFAHSIVAPDDLRGAWSSVGRLGNRPLASALFSNPHVTRSAMEYRRIDRRHPLHARIVDAGLAPPETLWARRSLFHLRRRPLLVTEVFLPAILTLDAKRPLRHVLRHVPSASVT